MSRFKATAGAYRRPMDHWWRRNPYFTRYMVREGSAVFLTIYALVLLAGLMALAHGPQAYAAWRASLATPVSLLFHALALAAVGYHSVTWFQVMPKTAPHLPFDAALVTKAGLAAAVACSLALVAVVLWATR